MKNDPNVLEKLYKTKLYKIMIPEYKQVQKFVTATKTRLSEKRANFKITLKI